MVPEYREYLQSQSEVGKVEPGPRDATPPVSEHGLGSDKRVFLDEGPLPFCPPLCPAQPVSASLPPPQCVAWLLVSPSLPAARR